MICLCITWKIIFIDAPISTDLLAECHINKNNLPCDTQANHDMFSEITSHGGQVHENLNTETLISDENKDIEDNDESNDGWTYDPISGYWIEDAGGCSHIQNIPIPIITKEKN